LTSKWRLLASFALIVVVLVTVMSIRFCHTTDDETDIVQKYSPSIKVTVENGCGFNGVANYIRRALAEKKVDVISTSNAKKYVYDETIIVVKINETADLKRLQAITGIKNVIYAENQNSIAPFIIIAGRDYQQYFR